MCRHDDKKVIPILKTGKTCIFLRLKIDTGTIQDTHFDLMIFLNEDANNAFFNPFTSLLNVFTIAFVNLISAGELQRPILSLGH